MKLRKLVSVTLALLLVVSLLPVGALAENIDADRDTVASEETFENNNATVTTNNGEIITNNGTIDTNKGTVETNAQTGTIDTNKGTVGKEDANGPNINTGNFGTVKTNEGTVLINQEKGTVETNATTGTISTNKGTVGKEGEDGNVVDGSGNFGVVKTNEGTILINQEGGTVKTNAQTGTIDTNNGFVGARDDAGDPILKPEDGTGNFGNIGENYGCITINGENATVETNNWKIMINNGEVTTNNGLVGALDENNAPVLDPDSNTGNFGTIGENKGGITINGEKATVDTNSGDIIINNGKVTTNNRDVDWNDGTVKTNNGAVGYNCGKVETNTIDGVVFNGTDENGVTGEVKTNYGTILTPTDENDEGYKAQYGVQVKNTDGGEGTTLLQAVRNEILELAKWFQRDGFELVGYEDVTPPSKEYPDGEYAEYSLTSDPDTDTGTQELTDTEFKATRPSILSLIWKAIAKPSGGSDGGDEPTSSGNTGRKNPTVLSSLSADKVSVGALIRCGKVIFKIIEVNDDSIRVATVDTLSKQSQEDMMGYLKQYLSADQIAKFIGQPELLDADEIAQFFKDNKAHIAFYAAKDLFEA